MRVVVLAVHPVKAAGTRLRAAQFLPALRAHGMSMEIWSFLRTDDLDRWLQGHLGTRIKAFFVGLLRVPQALRLIRGADVVVVRREALPLGPPLLERFAAKHAPVVWDVDDALWAGGTAGVGGVPRWLRAPAQKYEAICALASEVWAGNQTVAAWCRERADNVVEVPTVVDVASVRPVPPPASRRLAWIGSPSTVRHLEAIMPALESLHPPVELDVVGGHVRSTGDLTVRCFDWDEETERAILGRARVGLYPLELGQPFEEGKSGLKAIVYMAHGVPCIVSPNPANARIVRHGREGLHAASSPAWALQVARLLDDEDLWDACSRRAHQRALEHYSLARWAPVVVGRLVGLACSSQ